MLEFHYQEKYVNVTFTDFDTTTKQVGARRDLTQLRAEQRRSENFE